MDFDPEKITLLDLDSCSVHKGTTDDFGPTDQKLMSKSQSDCILVPAKYATGEKMSLRLTNLVAHTLTQEKYDSLTPTEALAYINTNKHKGGSYVINSKSETEPTYWVTLTKQNQTVLVKVPPKQSNKFRCYIKNIDSPSGK